METCEVVNNVTLFPKVVQEEASTEHVSIMEFFKRIDDTIGDYFSTGDPAVRTWFLVRQNSLPFLLCGMYIIFVKLIGPALMKNRRPFELRKAMIFFNLSVVATYVIAMSVFFIKLPEIGFEGFCYGFEKLDDTVYLMVRCCWLIYVVKYVEFIDTIFFILRKKQNLVTNLHVIHHTVVPLVAWIMIRTERSFLQVVPVFLNGFVHIVMYTYYGLAAVGPEMKKYLWWKKYLTILQMVQFVLILLFVVFAGPLTGCPIMKSSLWIDVFCGVVFLILFYNFYAQTFLKKQKSK